MLSLGELPWDKPVLDCADFVAFIKAPSCSRTPWCKIDNTALSLIRNVLRFEPTQRFTIAQIKASTWFVRTHKEPAYESSLVTNSRLIQRGGFDDDVDVGSQDERCSVGREQRGVEPRRRTPHRFRGGHRNPHHVEGQSGPLSQCSALDGFGEQFVECEADVAATEEGDPQRGARWSTSCHVP